MTDLLTEIKYLFPWMAEMGLDGTWLQNVVADTNSPEEFVLRLRQESAYKKRFPGLFRADGSMRMTEAEYIQRENDFRQVLDQGGFDRREYSTPASLKTFFESEQDPNELKDRVQLYNQISSSGQAVKDAFYVYAGLDLSTDDLFEAAVNKDFAAELQKAYVERTAAGFDYNTFLDRVTQVAGKRAADLVSRQDNTLTVQNLPTDPGLAKKVIDVLYSTGGGVGGRTLSLQELLASYEEALLGSAAGNAGLGIPTKDRVAQIRAAGIERARAQQAYLDFAGQQGALQGAAMRHGLGVIDRTTMEDAAFFGQAGAQRQLDAATAAEKAAGATGGTFRFDQNSSGRLYQRGLTS